MTTRRCVFLMYHELELPARTTCKSSPGYMRYVIKDTAFRQQMELIKESGYRGLSVTEALQYASEPSVCITFDDGCETDFITAAPILQGFGFRATFYLTAGFLGTPGYLTTNQVRELDAAGFEIGCHSMTHPYLSDLAESDMKREIMGAKLRIEEIVGQSIEHFSVPGGQYDARTLEMARSAGFRTVATSLFHANSTRTSPYELGRVAILRDTPLQEFADICDGQGLWKKRFRDRTRQVVRDLLGNKVYDQMRAVWLREPKR